MEQKLQQILSYYAVFDEAEEGGYNVSFPDFPGCVTFGKDFEESKEKEIGFVGSIASVYQEILEEVLSERGMDLSIVVRKPLDRLVDFHTS